MLLIVMKLGPAPLGRQHGGGEARADDPATALKFGELCADILPPGVVNFIVDQNDLGGALASHPDVAKVTFTGSTATGKKVMESVAGTLKRLTLQLGGNDAAIVLDDVDPGSCAQAVGGAMTNSGQVGLAIKRLYVHDSQYDAMCEEVGKLARETIVDDGLKQGKRWDRCRTRRSSRR